MEHEIDFDFFLHTLLEQANKHYFKTDEARLNREKTDQMDSDCETILPPNLKPFVMDCFSLLCEVDASREAYLYRQGMRDGIAILKAMRVLA